MHFLLSGCSYALASCKWPEHSICSGCLLSAVVYSRALLHHHRKPLPLHPAHPAANKDTGISAILFSTSSPTCCTKAAHYYYSTLSSVKQKITWAPQYYLSFPPVLSSPFHQLQLCMPTLGYHRRCPCGQGGKAAFQRARAFSPPSP